MLFARSLRELDAEGVVSASVALLLWPGGDAAIERVIKQGCDGVVVYGGAETVRSYRQDLGLHTKLIEYGPKYSFVMVTADALARTGLDAAARRIAHDVVMWEQSACSSPHAVYVENAAGATTADDLADALARALAEWARELPPGYDHRRRGHGDHPRPRDGQSRASDGHGLSARSARRRDRVDSRRAADPGISRPPA